MAGAGVTGYAAINARVRAMYSTLLSPQELAGLSEAEDFPTLVGALKHTVYGTYLESLSEKDLTPRRVLMQIKGRLADAYFSVIHMAPDHARPLLVQLYRYFEVGNLKAILRGIVTGATREEEGPLWEHVQGILFPLGSMTVLPAQEMVESGSVASAVDLLQGTRYEETLSFAMKRYSAEQNLFPLEVALDLGYWRQVWNEAKKLAGLDREYAVRIIGALMDMNNLMWAIRYRIYHHLSEEELINYTLPFGYHVRDEDVRAIAAGSEISTVVQRIYPDLADVNAMLEQPHSGLPQLEARLKRYVVQQCKAAFAGNPFHIGVPLAFLVLTDLEIQDLTVLIEAKSSRLAEEDYREFMLQVPGR
jgi:V/A-type H+-transporting ATPase subunit C